MTRRISVVENILSENDRLAAANRARLDVAGVFSLNLIASPGAGKTSLIEYTVRELLRRQLRLAVINGDLATSIDADRATAAGAISIQINTGGNCHLDASMINSALSRLPLEEIDLLLVENVGNLVCPANFLLGTHKTVLVASITEGDDKPYKYPGSYRGAQILVVNKMDLAPYVSFDMDHFRRGAESLNPGLQTFLVSCRTGDGLSVCTERSGRLLCWTSQFCARCDITNRP